MVPTVRISSGTLSCGILSRGPGDGEVEEDEEEDEDGEAEGLREVTQARLDLRR